MSCLFAWHPIMGCHANRAGELTFEFWKCFEYGWKMYTQRPQVTFDCFLFCFLTIRTGHASTLFRCVFPIMCSWLSRCSHVASPPHPTTTVNVLEHSKEQITDEKQRIQPEKTNRGMVVWWSQQLHPRTKSSPSPLTWKLLAGILLHYHNSEEAFCKDAACWTEKSQWREPAFKTV